MDIEAEMKALGGHIGANSRSTADALRRADLAAATLRLATIRAYAERASEIELPGLIEHLNATLAAALSASMKAAVMK